MNIKRYGNQATMPTHYRKANRCHSSGSWTIQLRTPTQLRYPRFLFLPLRCMPIPIISNSNILFYENRKKIPSNFVTKTFVSIYQPVVQIEMHLVEEHRLYHPIPKVFDHVLTLSLHLFSWYQQPKRDIMLKCYSIRYV